MSEGGLAGRISAEPVIGFLESEDACVHAEEIGHWKGNVRMKLPRSVFALLSLVALAGCAAPAAVPPQTGYPVGGEVFRLDVAEVEINRPAAMPAGTVIDMSNAVESWLREHLVAVGTSGRIRANINDAAVRESVIQRTARGGLSFDRTYQYDGMVDVRIDATDRSTQRAAFAGANASRSGALPSGASPDQRNQAASEVADGVMWDFEAGLSAEIRRRLARFLQ